jgi:hypothetical protein
MNLYATTAYLTKKMGEIPGKKAFQKLMYFIDSQGVPTSLNFVIYHYGPYSSTLDYETEDLELRGAITINKTGNSYTIYPGKHVDEILDTNQEFLNQYSDKIDYIAETLPKTPLELELWSTTHFIAKSLDKYYGGATKEKVVHEVKKIKKDKFSEQQISEAFDALITHNLIALKNNF